MAKSSTSAHALWLLLFCHIVVLSSAKPFTESFVFNETDASNMSAQNSSLLSNVACGKSLSPAFCSRCIMVHKTTDIKKCVLKELTQRNADGWRLKEKEDTGTMVDGRKYYLSGGTYLSTTAVADLEGVKGNRVIFAIAIDNCRRVSASSQIGPMTVGATKFKNVTMQEMANQLFALCSNREAVKVVLQNVYEGKKSAEAVFGLSVAQQSSSEQAFLDELELILGNRTVKYVSNVVCRAFGGTAVWSGTYVAMSALLEHHSEDVLPPQSQALTSSIFALLALQTYQYTIEYLEDLLDRPLGLALCGWGLWIIQAGVSRSRELVESLSPISAVPRIRDALLRQVLTIIGDGFQWWDESIGVTSLENAVAQPPAQCPLS